MARCSFCGGQFSNAQAVRAHLRHCPNYRRRRGRTGPPIGIQPLGSLPIGRSVPKAKDPQPGRDPVDREQRPLREIERPAPYDGARARTELHAFLEAQERRRKQEAAETLKQKRRQIIQRIKDQVVARWSSPGYTIPAETRAQALMEIERELSARAVEELAEWELVALAEGVRDKHYRPVMEAQDQAKRLEERRRREEQEPQRNRVREDAERAERQREEAQRAAEPRASQERTRQQEARVPALLEHGMDFAGDALQEVEDLDPRDRRSILRRVAGDLEAELTGKESERAVEARVDEILDEELGEVEDGHEDDGDESCDEDEDAGPYDEDDEDEGDEDDD